METAAKAPAKGKRFTKAEWSWIFYDWANSVYATNIMAAIFPIWYAMNATDLGNKMLGIGVSIASLVCAVLAPTLGAVADFKGYKKKLLAAFVIVGVLFTAIMAFVGSWQLMLLGYVLSRIGFSGANVFYDSFLTDVTTSEKMDKVSAWGYAMGYIGGSTIPFVISIVVMVLRGMDEFSFKFAILITSVWWATFSLPILLNVKQLHYVDTPPKQLARSAGRNLLRTARDVVLDRGMLIFMLAYFCYIDGVDTIISISTSYGSTLGLGSIGMILALLVTQLVAVPFSILSSRIAAKFGTIRVIVTAIGVYFCICVVGFFMGQIMEPHQMAYTAQIKEARASFPEVFSSGTADAKTYEKLISDLIDDGKDQLAEEDRPAAFAALFDEKVEKVMDPAGVVYPFSGEEARMKASEAVSKIRERIDPYVNDPEFPVSYHASRKTASILFWILATLVGTVQGGIQALSRSYFGKLVPANRSAEFFGFYDIFGKFAAVLGPALYALCYALTDRPSVGILSLITLFAVGAVLLITGKSQLNATVDRVREANRTAGLAEVEE